MVHIHLNQRTTKMLIDESKLQLIVQLNFLNCKKQHTNLKLRTFYLRLKTKQIVSEEITPLKLIAIQQLYRTLRKTSQSQIRNLGKTIYKINIQNARIIRILELLE